MCTHIYSVKAIDRPSLKQHYSFADPETAFYFDSDPDPDPILKLGQLATKFKFTIIVLQQDFLTIFKLF
jgi:hypothetical protein